MEPVTHILTGACLARTGLNRKAAYTTLAMAVAAEFPDIDTLWSLDGPVAGFQHHRGLTHTFLGLPFEAGLIVAGVYGLHRLRVRRAGRRPPAGSFSALPPPLTAAPVRWGLLYGFTLLALLSHLWLDYTNNYGLRPFYPFNPRWYAASITFIFDPAMFLLLLGALVLPPLFRLVSREVGARRQPFPARGWAVAALCGVCGLWAWREVEHSHAEQMALTQSYAAPAPVPSAAGPDADGPLPAPPPPSILPAQRAAASPDPINPFRWYTVTDFGPLYQLGTADLRAGTLVPQQGTEAKLPPRAEVAAAEASSLGRAYLDWSPMPFIDVVTDPGEPQSHDGAEPLPPGAATVTFRDPRFLGDMPWLQSSSSSRSAPLTGAVTLDAQGHVLRETFGGKVQR